MKKRVLLITILIVASVLRLWKLNSVPVSLFGDELDVGYQAYSVLKTGRDYYGNFMPIHFHSLAEWRTPLYLYSSVPTVAVFGITPLGVRLPAAIFGILGVWVLYLLVRELTKNDTLALASGLLLAISPWHIQYSRAGFEVTFLLLLLLLGLWLFFKSLKNPKWLWLSVACFTLTPWVYSTAKLFTPLLMVFLFILYRKEILSLGKKYLVSAAIVGLIVGLPIAVSTIFGGGSQRFNYISVFSDPTIEPEVGTARERDGRMRGELGAGLSPTLIDKIIHNKFTFVGGKMLSNYLQAFSTDFLFIKGDPNLRQSIGTGEFYKIELLFLLIGGAIFFLGNTADKKFKLVILFWVLAGVIPAVLTRDGGNHATRLILILPPIILLITYGLLGFLKIFRGTAGKIVIGSVIFFYLISFSLYLHNYYVHWPWDSERWWHAGYQEAIQSTKAMENGYDKIVISTAAEPPWIFFAGWYEFPPEIWQREFPIGNDVVLPGFGKISHIGKFYFGTPDGGLYEWGKVLDKKTLYVASEKEVKVNLIMEPDRTPGNLKLIKSVAYPSGEPAFYLFTGTK